METEEKSLNSFQKFRMNNEDKIKEKHICDICGGSYTYFNKSTHKKRPRHINVINVIKRYETKHNMQILKLLESE